MQWQSFVVTYQKFLLAVKSIQLQEHQQLTNYRRGYCETGGDAIVKVEPGQHAQKSILLQ